MSKDTREMMEYKNDMSIDNLIKRSKTKSEHVIEESYKPIPFEIYMKEFIEAIM